MLAGWALKRTCHGRPLAERELVASQLFDVRLTEGLRLGSSPRGQAREAATCAGGRARAWSAGYACTLATAALTAAATIAARSPAGCCKAASAALAFVKSTLHRQLPRWS